MTRKTIIGIVGAVATLTLVGKVQDVESFAPVAFTKVPKSGLVLPRFAEETKPTEEASITPSDEEGDEEKDDIDLDKVESLGRGAAKVG